MNRYIKIGSCMTDGVSFDMARSGNRHIAICGKSGAGKSVAGQKIITDVIKGGGTVVTFDMHWLFDNNNIFQPLKPEIDSMMHEIDADLSGIQFPLLTPMEYVDGTREESLNVVASVTDLLSRSLKLKCRQRDELFRAMNYIAEEHIYSMRGISALDDALYMLESEVAANIQGKIRTILNKNVFRDGPCFIDEGKLNVIRLSKFSESDQALIANIVLSYIWRLANTGAFLENGLYLFCDECQNLDLGQNGIINTILAEGRKLGIHLILITQSLGGSCRSRVAQCLLQTGHQLYFMPAEGEAVTVARLISAAMYRDWQLVLKTLKIGECVAVGSMSVNEVAYNRPIKINI